MRGPGPGRALVNQLGRHDARGPESVATFLALALDAHSQGRKGQCLSLLGRARESLAGGRQVKRRDLFAGCALAGMLADAWPANASDAQQVVDSAVELADRLLVALDG